MVSSSVLGPVPILPMGNLLNADVDFEFLEKFCSFPILLCCLYVLDTGFESALSAVALEVVDFVEEGIVFLHCDQVLFVYFLKQGFYLGGGSEKGF